jgi:cytochrome P450
MRIPFTGRSPGTQVPQASHDSSSQRERSRPGPHDPGAGGTRLSLGDDPLRFLLRTTRTQGDVARYDNAFGPVYVVNHPDHIARVLTHSNYRRARSYPFKMVLGEGVLSSDGDYWRRQRRLMQPSFHRERLVALGPRVTDAARVMLEGWQGSPQPGQPLDIGREIGCLTLDVGATGMFGDCLRPHAEALSRALSALIGDLGGLVGTQFGMPFSFSPTRNERFQAMLGALDQVVYDAIRGRRRKPAAESDLLSLLLQSRDEATGEGLSDRQVRDEVVTLLFAGSESTALMLSWAWYLLAEHPDVDSRLYDELARVLDGRLPTVEELPRLPYTRMVIQESLRLYPPVWALFRQAVADDEIGGCHVAANAAIIISAYAMQRHPAYWEDPERFIPERFAPEKMDRRPRYTYFPFGGGPHLCLGNQFGMTQGQLILATVAQRYRLERVPGHPVEPLPGVTLRQRQGFLAMLVGRPGAAR